MSDLRDIAGAFEALGKWLKAIAGHVSAQDGHLVQIRENIHHANNVMAPVPFEIEELKRLFITQTEASERLEARLTLLHDNMIEGFRRQGVRIEKTERITDGQRQPETR